MPRCIAGLLALLAAIAPAAVRADAKGDALLKEAFGKLGAAKAMTESLNATLQFPGAPPLKLNGTVAALKPNFLRIELKGPVSLYFVCDGKSYYSNLQQALNNDQNSYVRNKAQAKPTEFSGVWEGEVDAFYGGAANAAKAKTTYVGTAKVGDVECDVVKAVMGEPNARTITYSIGKADKLIYKSVVEIAGDGDTSTQTNLITRIKLDATLKPEDFVFKAPAGAKEVTPPGIAADLSRRRLAARR